MLHGMQQFNSCLSIGGDACAAHVNRALKSFGAAEDEQLREYLRAYFADTQAVNSWNDSLGDELLAVCWFVLLAISYVACLLCFLYFPLQAQKSTQDSCAGVVVAPPSTFIPATQSPVKLDDEYVPGNKLVPIVFFMYVHSSGVWSLDG